MPLTRNSRPSLRTAFKLLALLITLSTHGQTPEPPPEVTVDWLRTTPFHSIPTLQVVVNPMLLRGARMHDNSFAALRNLGADFVRYVPWLPYPRQAVAELAEPSAGKTSWDFSHIDPTFDDFMRATAGHSVILNFSTIPAWMFKTSTPVTFPDDPNQVFWHYTQGTDLRDPTMREAAAYFARLLSWYTLGGFTDELGQRHTSGHHYKIGFWEVLNEIEYEHHWTPEAYTRFYDAVTAALLQVDPHLKFVGLALTEPGKHPDMFEYFLNPAHHAKGAPLDFISYHFYAHPSPDQTLDQWQYTFFDQEEGFLNTVRFVENLRKRFSPTTRTDLDELGVILPEDEHEIHTPGYVARDEPPAYWNLAGALYADLFLQCARLGIDVIGESQLVGYKSQFPSVTMMNYTTSEPNARFWVLDLLHRELAAPATLAETSTTGSGLTAQAFHTTEGKRLLILNKRNFPQQLLLPAEGEGGTLHFVAPSTGTHPPASATLTSRTLTLEPFEVAVLALR